MIEVGKIEKSGFCPQVIFEGFKTAFITYSEDYGERKIFKRHLETDEVFVLIDGGAVIFTHEGGLLSQHRLKGDALTMSKRARGITFRLRPMRFCLWSKTATRPGKIPK